METYDDRPVSVYDNLNTQTNTPTKPNTLGKTATVYASIDYPQPATSSMKPSHNSPSASNVIENGAPLSPYADISFHFGDKLQQQQQQQQQHHHHQQHSLPNGNRNLNDFEHSIRHSTEQVQPNTTAVYYPSPYRSTNLGLSPQTATHGNTTSSSVVPDNTINNTTRPNVLTESAAPLASPVQRPLSQHSQTEPNEASLSIAAVKAALNDAKSKFFGLNGYAPDNNRGFNYESQPSSVLHQQPLIQPSAEIHKPKVQIITPTTSLATLSPPTHKPQPKYQNIPPNSAIFRNQTQPLPPPDLPPKPAGYTSKGSSPSSSASAHTDPSTPGYPMASSNSNSNPNSNPPSITGSRTSPTRTQLYKQIPLNDIDVSQPSQAVYMATTVPQNIKGSKIAGRHTPTRNSLRHSRMLVVNNKNYQGSQHPNPMNFKYPILACWLLLLEVVIGILLLALAIWTFLLSPNTNIKDNPYWSGLGLLVAGILGLVLIRYHRVKRHRVRENCFVFLRANSYLISLLALLLCCVALICSSIHLARLTASDTHCEFRSSLKGYGSCSCIFRTNIQGNSTKSGTSTDVADSSSELVAENDNYFQDNSYTVHYEDMTCAEVTGEWTYILCISVGLNALGFIISCMYVVLLACCRRDSKQQYTSVNTSTF